MDLSRTVYEKNGDFAQKSHFSHLSVFNVSAEGFFLTVMGPYNYSNARTRKLEKFEDYVYSS